MHSRNVNFICITVCQPSHILKEYICRAIWSWVSFRCCCNWSPRFIFKTSAEFPHAGLL